MLFSGDRLDARFLLDNGRRRRRSYGLIAIFCQRFAGENNRFIRDISRRRACTARTFLTAVVISTLLAAAIVISAKFTALRRSIFGGRKIASSRTTLRTTTTITAAPASPAAAAAIAVTAPAIILALAIIAIVGATRIVLSRVETRREILRRRSVGIRLTLFA